MATVGTHAINPALYKKLPYDPVRDFTPIALVAAAPVAIVVHPSQNASDVAGLIALAKQAPGKLQLRIRRQRHARPPDRRDVQGGRRHRVAARPLQGQRAGGDRPDRRADPDDVRSVAVGAAARRGRQARAIAVTSASRSPALPGAPTVAESGFKDFEVTAWWGVYAPAGLPVAQAAALAVEIEKVVKSSAFRDTLGPLGVLPVVLTLGAFGDFQSRETAKWGKAVRDSGASVD
jgi:tripartite-type tricarboxylate transporter receptor subunit TctC